MTKILKRGLGSAVVALSLITAACDDGLTSSDLTGPDLDSQEVTSVQGSGSVKGGNTSKKSGPAGTTTSATTSSAPTTGITTTDLGSLASGLVPRKWPIDRDITRSAIIGPEGGWLSIGATGFQLEIPAGALSERTEITVTAKAGKYELYEFGPHGIHFDRPVTMGFSTESRAVARALVGEASGVYLGEGDAVLETFRLRNLGFYVTFETTHFSRYALKYSGYALAW